MHVLRELLDTMLEFREDAHIHWWRFCKILNSYIFFKHVFEKFPYFYQIGFFHYNFFPNCTKSKDQREGGSMPCASCLMPLARAMTLLEQQRVHQLSKRNRDPCISTDKHFSLMYSDRLLSVVSLEISVFRTSF
jgi:hypothetical protein